MKYQLLPPLSTEEYAALEASIIAHGVLVPVEYDEAGEILDGHHRVAICRKLRKDWPRVVRSGLSEVEKRALVRELNIARRQLTTFQKQSIIAEQLRDTPQISNRAIARLVGVDPKTVAAQRSKMEVRGLLRPAIVLEGRNGKVQPARKPPLPPSPLLSDGVRLDGLAFHQVLTRIADCERDLSLLREVTACGQPTDDRMTVRDIMPAAFFEVALA